MISPEAQAAIDELRLMVRILVQTLVGGAGSSGDADFYLEVDGVRHKIATIGAEVEDRARAAIRRETAALGAKPIRQGRAVIKATPAALPCSPGQLPLPDGVSFCGEPYFDADDAVVYIPVDADWIPEVGTGEYLPELVLVFETNPGSELPRLVDHKLVPGRPKPFAHGGVVNFANACEAEPGTVGRLERTISGINRYIERRASLAVCGDPGDGKLDLTAHVAGSVGPDLFYPPLRTGTVGDWPADEPATDNIAAAFAHPQGGDGRPKL